MAMHPREGVGVCEGQSADGAVGGHFAETGATLGTLEAAALHGPQVAGALRGRA